MQKNKVINLVISLILLLLIVGCNQNEIIDQTDIEDGEKILAPSHSKEYEKVTIEGLKEKLSGAIGVELKNIENEAIGKINDREDILEFVEEIFQYPQQEEFPNDSKENTVIGPMNFYFNDDEDIFGLVKSDYIYIEGYYFLLSNQEVEKIEKAFLNRIIEAPVSGN